MALLSIRAKLMCYHFFFCLKKIKSFQFFKWATAFLAFLAFLLGSLLVCTHSFGTQIWFVMQMCVCVYVCVYALACSPHHLIVPLMRTPTNLNRSIRVTSLAGYCDHDVKDHTAYNMHQMILRVVHFKSR